MECLAVAKPPEGSQWLYEIKLDGYRAIAIKADGHVSLLSRRKKSFNRQFATVAAALAELPETTVVDGEIVALDDEGRPKFDLLQHSRSAASSMYLLSPMECRTGRYDRATRANKAPEFDPKPKARLSAASAGNCLEPVPERVPYQIQSSDTSLPDRRSRSDLQFRLLDQHHRTKLDLHSDRGPLP